jgi:hypothetical protein
VDRWLYFVLDQDGGAIRDAFQGTSMRDGVEYLYTYGSMEAVGPLSARACYECATVEL